MNAPPNKNISHAKASHQNKADKTLNGQTGPDYKSLVENTADVIWAINLQRRFTYLSPQFQTLFGYTVADSLDTDSLTYVHPDDLEMVIESVGNLLRGIGPQNKQFRHKCFDGSYIWVMVKASLIKDNSGNTTGMQGVLRDISEFKKMELALSENEARYRGLVEGAADVIWSADANGLITYLSPHFENLFGYNPDEFIGKKGDAYIHEDDREKFSIAHRNMRDSLQPATVEYRILHANGSYIWVMGTTTTVIDPITGQMNLQGVIRGINDRKSVELALAEAQARFRRITENVPGMIYQVIQRADQSLAMLHAGLQCKALFEVEPEDAKRDIQTLFQRIHPDDLLEIHHKMSVSAQNLSQFRAVYRVVLPKQGIRWRQSISQPSRAEDGSVVWDGIVTDIDDQKQTELKLQRANTQLAEAAKMKDTFLANMSHELRTPLTAILGMFDGLHNGLYGPVTEEQADSLKIIEESSNHLLDLINEVLDLAKVESGFMKLNFSSVNIASLCQSSVQLVTPQARTREINLILHIPDDLPEIPVDEKRIRQVLVNLLSNAVKFTQNTGTVTLAVENLNTNNQCPDYIRFSVLDNGIGIEESEIPSLFAPFHQVQTSLNRNYDGIGLGLALVKRFVDLHSGIVGVKSREGDGSCFYFDLPVQQTAAPDAVDAQTDQQQRAESNFAVQQNTDQSINSNKPLILLAEDNNSVAKAIKRYLEFSGYRIHRVTNGQCAIDATADLSPELVLMDIQMPQVDGLEAIKRLREIPSTGQIPIIALTGLAMMGDEQRCIDAGADHYLSKPYRMQELVTLIDSTISPATV